MPHRYFTSEISGDTALLTGADAHHLGKVMRARIGEQVILCDGSGFDYDGVITAIEPDQVQFSVANKRPCTAEPKAKVTVFAGYPKQDKLELILQKSVELGRRAHRTLLQPVLCGHPQKGGSEKPALCPHCRRGRQAVRPGILPEVELPLNINQLPGRFSEFDAILFFYEKGGRPLRQCVPAEGGRIALITGAEGGFSEEEAQALIDAGAIPVGLGPRILRCETAPIAALAAVMTLTGDLE